MAEKQNSQVAVQKAVNEVMIKNQAKWKTITELKNRYEQFTRNLTRIDEYDVILLTPLAPLKEKKVNSMKVLVEKVFPISSVLGVFAYDIGDRKLGKLVGVKSSEVDKMSVELLLKYCKRILKISELLFEQIGDEGKKAPKHLIADYGLTSEHLETFKSAMDNCSIDTAEYATARLARKKSKVKLDRCIRENNQLLKKKLDRMIHLFRDTQKTFYSGYIKARIPVEAVPDEKKTADPPSSE